MYFEYFIIILLGLTFGSFANVLINRLPFGITIISPSQCPQCKTNIKFYDNIPVLSYIILKAQSRCCQKKISIQYPIIEIIASIMALISFSYGDLTLNTIFIYLLALTLVILFMTDLKEYILPNTITYPIALTGLSISLFNFNPFGTLALDSLMGGLLSGLFFFLISKFYFILRKREGLGLGDVKMISMLGFWLGVELILLIIIISSILGIITGLILIFLKKIEAQEYLPYGCFISIAALIVILLKLEFSVNLIKFIL